MNSFNQVKKRLKTRVGEVVSKTPLSRLFLELDPKYAPSRLDEILAEENFGNGELLLAEKYLRRASVNNPSRHSYRYRLGVIYQKLQRYDEALQEFTAALTISRVPKYLYHRGRTFESLELVHDAINDFFEASNLADAEERPTQALRNLIVSAPMTVAERTQYMTRAAEAGIEGSRWLVDLGRLHSEQRLNSGAVYWYSRAENMMKLDAGDLYRFALAMHLQGNFDAARDRFAQLLDRKELSKHKFGLASLHASKGNWTLARDEYSRVRAVRAGVLAEYYYQTGMSHDRSYDFASAARYYSLAVAEDQGHPYWWWRAGFAFEKLGKFSTAAKYYWQSSKLQPNLNGAYHAGRMKAKLQDYAGAIKLFSFTPEISLIIGGREPGVLPSISPGLLSEATTARHALEMRTIGIANLRRGNFKEAACILNRSIKGLEQPDPIAYAALGYALNALGKQRESVNSYLQMQEQQAPDGVGRSVKLSPWEIKLSHYLAYRAELPIQESAILYEVGHGSSVSCNPLAIYRQAINTPELQDHTHIWVVNGDTPVPDDVRFNPQVIIVQRESEIYFRWLAVAKHLVNNTSFGSYFIRRDGQKYLNTWHGTPQKTLGKSVKDSGLSYGNISRNLLQITHLAVGNEWTAEKLLEEHGVNSLATADVAITGSPRLDRLHDLRDDADNELKKMLGIRDDIPLAVYVPTWRGALDSENGVRYSAEVDQAAISALEDAGFQVLYSAHRFVHENQNGLDEMFRLIPLDIDLYSVLRLADVLVTDYSSVWCDFLVVDKPIVFYQYDRDQYSAQRGLYEIEEPGPVVRNTTALTERLQAVRHGADDYRRQRADARAAYNLREDGQASQRVVDWFLLDKSENVHTRAPEGQPAALFRQSFIPNGIATSFRALTTELTSTGQIASFVLIDPRSINDDSERRRQLDALASEVTVLPRVGRMLFTVEERWIEKKHTTGAGQITDPQFNVLMNAYRREFDRLFGSTSFETVCEFDGYSRFWTMLFAAAPRAGRKSVYLHNNMMEEFSAKHPELGYVFGLYGYFDKLISVSESVNTENILSISDEYRVQAENFAWANNMINSADILSRADLPVDSTIENFMASSGRLAVAVGRLSTEKGHDRLLRALTKIRGDIRLMIVGGGPERENLEALIRRLGIEEKVLITGHLANPYPVMKRASAVTLLSRWEGQGLTVLEAMLLGRPVVATDIPGPRSIMADYGGTLVPNSDEGVRQALELIVSDRLEPPNFDFEEYNTAAFARALSSLMPQYDSA